MIYELIEIPTDYGYYVVIDLWGDTWGYRCAYCVRMFDTIGGVKCHMGWHRPRMDGCGGNPAKSDRLKYVKRPILIMEERI